MTNRTLVFTDVVDSTLVVQRVGDEAAARLWAEHDRCARELMLQRNGREIDRTDGFFLLFDDAAQAVGFALSYHELVSGLSLHARVGIHVGDVHLRANPDGDVARGAKPIEVEGLAKPMAARIMSLAQGGQTLLSAEARDALGSHAQTAVQRHGHYRLKGIDSPVEIFEVGKAGHAPFTPPPDTEKAYRVVRSGDLWQSLKGVSNNLPTERDGFIGRTSELRAIAARLDAGTRLLTIAGPGGAGKTRLVRRYGRVWMGNWPGGVYFCDLSESRSVDGICFAAASALQLQLGSAEAVVQIGHAIAGRGRCLLILDNFEQVLEHADATVGRWIDRAGEATFLVTSRERLHLRGEEFFPLEPLPLATDSVELFCLRAAAQRPGFALTDANYEAIAGVVRLLDGLPLAIELAAARIPVLSPAQLLERLNDRFQVLASARPTTARQSTMRNAIDWSWTLLNSFEQTALAQCSVFEGGFDLAAVEGVLNIGDASSGAPPVLEVVQSLLEKSLLRAWVPTGHGHFDIDEPLFGMYVSIRDYARERLRASGAEVERMAEERHGIHFASFGSDDAIEGLSSHDGARRRHRLILELDNLVAACRRAIGRTAVDTAVSAFRAAWEVIELRGPVTVATALGQQLTAMPGLADEPLLVALATVALALHRVGQTDEAARSLDRALGLSRSLGALKWEGRVLGQLGTLRRDTGHVEQAQRDFEAALSLHRLTGDRRAEGATLGNLGNLFLEKGLMDKARRHYEDALSVNVAIGNRRVEGSVLGNLGLLHYEQGRTQEALEHYERALAIHREVGSKSFEGTVLGNIGLLRFEQGLWDESKAHYVAALTIHCAVGNRRDEGIVLNNLGELLFARESIGEAEDRYRAALAIARELGYRRLEGAALGDLGALLAVQGRLQDARQALDDGELILRDLGDQVALGKLLCVRCRVEICAGQIHSAQAALSVAEAIADATGADTDSELGGEIGKLRSVLTTSALAVEKRPQ